MKNVFKPKLSNLVVNSSLTEDQKLLWELFLKISGADEDEAVYEAVDEDNENLLLLTEHLRNKILDMRQTSKKAWQALAGNEIKYAGLLN